MKPDVMVIFSEFSRDEFHNSIAIYQDLLDLDGWLSGKQKRSGKDLDGAIRRITNRAKRHMVFGMDNHPYYINFMAFCQNKIGFARAIADANSIDKPNLIERYFEKYPLD